jgi:hypothetical protein
MPGELRFKAVENDREQAEILRGHPLESVKEILQTPALTRAQRDRILVAYEHHIGRDGSGFPRALPGKGLHLFTCIVSLADRFDELTTEHPSEMSICPSKALELMAMIEERRFDPRLLRVFIHMMTPFPVGTLVELTTGELAVVYRHQPEPDLRFQPLVKIVKDTRGNLIAPILFNLAEMNEDRTEYLCGIVGSLPPDTLGTHPATLVFSSGPPRAGAVESA